MLHAGSCAFCDHQGWLGFYRCGDSATIILLCDECDTVWTSPEERNSGGTPSRVGDPPNYLVKQLGVSISGGRDATREEIAAYGWEAEIQGEYQYQRKGTGRP